jgi:hypothetical protein
VVEQIIEIQPLSTRYVTLFVATEDFNNAPVTVYAHDTQWDETSEQWITGDLVSLITINGQSEAGDLIDTANIPGQPVSLFEVHDPNLVEPLWDELQVELLSDKFENPNLKSPNLKSPNWKSPNWKSSDYQNPNWKSPNLKSPNWKSTSQESTSLDNPNLKSPNLKSPNLKSEAFVDVTFTVESENNTTTAINADFGYGGTELDTQSTGVQVIAWEDDDLESLQGCKTGGLITETKVIASKSNPNLKSLAPADIDNPFEGEVSFPLGPGGEAQLTLRIFCATEAECQNLVTLQAGDPDYENPNYPACLEEEEVDPNCTEYLSKLQASLGWIIYAQKANTVRCSAGVEEGSCVLTDDEVEGKDTVPPTFNFPNGEIFETELTGEFTTIDLEDGTGFDGNKRIRAFDEGVEVDVACLLLTDPEQGMPADAPIESTAAECFSDPDANGNIGHWTGFVSVVDTTAPSITAPADTSIEATGLTTAVSVNDCDTGRLGTPTGNDLAGTPTYDCGAPLSLSLGDNSVTWTATDSSGNTATATQTVTVIDTTLPSITAPGAVTNFEANGDPSTVTDCSVLGTPTVDDLTGTPTYDCGTLPLSLNLGENTVTWTATDSSGNQDSADQTVTVVDTIAPSITAPAAASIEADGDLTTVTDCSVLGTPTGDDVTGTPTYSCGPLPLSLILGENTVTWTATDSSGNTATAPQTVTVVDTTAPSITAPASITDFEANGDPSTVTECSVLGTPTVSDLVGTPTYGCGTLPLSFSLGANTVTWTATDSSGNTDTATQTVTVVDTTPPVITAISGDLTELATSSSGANVDFIDFEATDFYLASASCVPASGSEFPIGPTTVNCTATDTSGNEATDDFVVTVEFQYGTTDISAAKGNPRTGTSIPVYYAWTVDGVPVHVEGTQVMEVANGACPGTSAAKTPGNSGFQELADFSWQWNFQAVDDNGDELPAERTGTPYCLTVTLTNSLVPAGQSQSGTIILKNNK